MPSAYVCCLCLYDFTGLLKAMQVFTLLLICNCSIIASKKIEKRQFATITEAYFVHRQRLRFASGILFPCCLNDEDDLVFFLNVSISFTKSQYYC
ncbi:hypothetical protein BDC45DRAFT_494392 [Circinella umbellata]|nr:hypothetical protein BDC45DRAFT_494368 [Circinella umbellata]KAI7860422.1 hypothetical protein BDC45DRAFT_494392 [Circinella umbellata]